TAYGGTFNESSPTSFTVATNQWRWFTAPVNTTISHTGLQLQIVIDSPTLKNLDMDGATMAATTVSGLLPPPPVQGTPSTTSSDSGAVVSWTAPWQASG